jgi:hypothetical protein
MRLARRWQRSESIGDNLETREYVEKAMMCAG